MRHTSEGGGERRSCGKILWNLQIQADKQAMANQADIVMVDKKAVVMDVAVPKDITKKEHEKLEKYQVLRGPPGDVFFSSSSNICQPNKLYVGTFDEAF